VACDGVIGTWEDLLIPLIAGIGDQHLRTGSLIDVEHVLTAAACDVLAEASAALSRPAQHPPVLLSCAEEEQHTLSLHVLAAALAEEGVATWMLGGRVPRRALAELRDHPSRPTIFVGGPGWDRHQIPDAVEFLPSLAAAVSQVEAALGLDRPAQQQA